MSFSFELLDLVFQYQFTTLNFLDFVTIECPQSKEELYGSMGVASTADIDFPQLVRSARRVYTFLRAVSRQMERENMSGCG